MFGSGRGRRKQDNGEKRSKEKKRTNGGMDKRERANGRRRRKCQCRVSRVAKGETDRQMDGMIGAEEVKIGRAENKKGTSPDDALSVVDAAVWWGQKVLSWVP